VLAREREHLLALLGRESAPQVPGRQRETEWSGAVAESTEPWHHPILAQRLLVVPVGLAVAVPVACSVVRAVLLVLLLVTVRVPVTVPVVLI
jgi:hypothetical protein